MFSTLDEIKAHGFLGFCPVTDLLRNKCQDVPNVPGVYLVLRSKTDSPRFLSESVGGWFKGKNPTVEELLLRSLWVHGSPVIYIGKAGGQGTKATLKSRIRAYIDFGSGKPVGHYGGRYIWQLEDHASLVFCWKPTDLDAPAVVETELISFFSSKFGKRPFANLRD